MFLTKIKKRFIQKRIDELFISSHQKERLENSTIKKVGILTTREVSDQVDLVNKIEATLPDVRNVKIYSLRTYNKRDKKSYKHFSENDINWQGKILDASLQSFVDEPLDLLICYFDKNDLLLEYITLSSKAAFKVGLSGVNQRLFHMEVIESIKNIDSINKELKKYLKILGKIDELM